MFMAVGRIAVEALGRFGDVKVLVKDEDLYVAFRVPSSSSTDPCVVWTEDHKLGLALDGYLVTDSPVGRPSLVGHLRSLAEAIRRDGTILGLKRVLAGAFNLVVIDREHGTVDVVNDRFGALPLYYARVNEGVLFSTSPVALASTGLIPKELDYTACAEWAYIGYTLGDRHFLKAIKVFPRATVFHWNRARRSGAFEQAGYDPLSVQPTADRGDLDEIADRISAACRRLNDLGERTAHFQSAGMDSRLILAAWPQDQELACYTYGTPGSAEVAIAQAIAGIRGSSCTHVLPEGDEVAEALDAMFDASGVLVYPDRYLAARAIRAQGFHSVLDGFLGDVFLGGTYYSSDRHFSWLSRCGRYATLFKDQKISHVGLERITEALLHEISEVKEDGPLAQYLSDESVAKLRAEWPNIREDAYQVLKSLLPAGDSMAILFRNFKVANRSLHAITQQGVMSRQFLQVYYPFTNDFPVLDYLLTLRPHVTAYRKFYFDLFRRRFQPYAEVEYGASLLPLKRSALAHKWSSIALSSHVPLPFVTGRAKGNSLNWYNWPLWLKNSRPLRDKVASWLDDSGLGEKDRVCSSMGQLATGAMRGSGKVFHLAAIGKWASLAKS